MNRGALKSAFVVFAMLFFCNVQKADAQSEVFIDLSAGVGFPTQTERLTEQWGHGLHVGGVLGLSRPGEGRFSYRLHFGYTNFTIDEDAIPPAVADQYDPDELEDFIVDGESSTNLSIGFQTAFRLLADQRLISPYILSGFGLTKIDLGVVNAAPRQVDSIDDIPPSVEAEQKLSFGINAGLGVEVPTSEQVALFAEGLYDRTLFLDEDYQQFPIRGGIRVVFE